MYFDNLAAANKNLNGGCDLENIDPIGKAQVNVDGALSVSARDGSPIRLRIRSTFTVHNLFQKTLTVYSKGADTEQHRLELGRQDRPGARAGHRRLAARLRAGLLDGRSNAAGFRVFAGELPAPTADDPGRGHQPRSVPRAVHHLPGSVGLGRLCTFTDRWGNTAIEVFNSGKTKVDVIAEYVNEGILRDTIADFAAATLGQTAGDHGADGPPTSHVPSPTTLQQAVVVGATGPVIAAEAGVKTIKSKQAKLVKKVLHKIRFAKVVTPFHEKAKLHVRVNGKAGMVKLRITILSDGKSHTYFRFIPVLARWWPTGAVPHGISRSLKKSPWV